MVVNKELHDPEVKHPHYPHHNQDQTHHAHDHEKEKNKHKNHNPMEKPPTSPTGSKHEHDPHPIAKHSPEKAEKARLPNLRSQSTPPRNVVIEEDDADADSNLTGSTSSIPVGLEVDLIPSDFRQDKDKDPSQTKLKHKEIVSTNIRHFFVFFWILLFTNVTLTTAYIAIPVRLITLDSDLLSVSGTKAYLIPCAIVSAVFTLIHCYLAHVRARKLLSDFYLKYRFSGIMLMMHFLVIITFIGLELGDAASSLEGILKSDLNYSLVTGNVSDTLSATQSQRKCCGVHNFSDWSNASIHHFNASTVKEHWSTFSDPDEEEANKVFFPKSCCTEIMIDAEGYSHCQSKRLWSDSCYSREQFWTVWYMGWYMGTLLAGLFLTVAMHLQIRKIYRYCKKHRPYWFGKEKLRKAKHGTH